MGSVTVVPTLVLSFRGREYPVPVLPHPSHFVSFVESFTRIRFSLRRFPVAISSFSLGPSRNCTLRVSPTVNVCLDLLHSHTRCPPSVPSPYRARFWVPCLPPDRTTFSRLAIRPSLPCSVPYSSLSRTRRRTSGTMGDVRCP